MRVHYFLLYSYVFAFDIGPKVYQRMNKISELIGYNNIAKTIICTRKLLRLYHEGDKKLIKYYFYKRSTLDHFSNLMKKMNVRSMKVT